MSSRLKISFKLRIKKTPLATFWFKMVNDIYILSFGFWVYYCWYGLYLLPNFSTYFRPSKCLQQSRKTQKSICII
jgi:hypothetical protein